MKKLLTMCAIGVSACIFAACTEKDKPADSTSTYSDDSYRTDSYRYSPDQRTYRSDSYRYDSDRPMRMNPRGSYGYQQNRGTLRSDSNYGYSQNRSQRFGYDQNRTLDSTRSANPNFGRDTRSDAYSQDRSRNVYGSRYDQGTYGSQYDQRRLNTQSDSDMDNG